MYYGSIFTHMHVLLKKKAGAPKVYRKTNLQSLSVI